MQHYRRSVLFLTIVYVSRAIRLDMLNFEFDRHTPTIKPKLQAKWIEAYLPDLLANQRLQLGDGWHRTHTTPYQRTAVPPVLKQTSRFPGHPSLRTYSPKADWRSPLVSTVVSIPLRLSLSKPPAGVALWVTSFDRLRMSGGGKGGGRRLAALPVGPFRSKTAIRIAE
ncbi:hypothetical protein [Novosphingobium sp. PhB165]|uniref:hypothetical protein n=1 Tax=Novosphingobium sp. PhB165 TaxID=2485105 RepID=UPI001404B6AB|nr:hypothetical protein [Novosphingobium sp. PhB165]